jgi:NhaP-type Na+/H+ or K+/H+ antiporter
VEIGFAEALLVLGVLLAVAAALSGWLQGTVLSITVLSVLAGLVLSWTDVLTVAPGALIVVFTVELALILTLFSDGLLVEDELLRSHWGPPARALVLAMPITLCLLAVAAKVLFADLSWAEAFLLGAVLSPTDPVVTSAVVTSRRIPARIRHTLNLESGLNDGLALPFVLFFLVLATNEGSAGVEGAKLAGEAAVGGLLGVALAFGAAWLLPRLPRGGIELKYEGVYALGLAFVAFGVAEVTFGNGLIAVFVAGIALALARHGIPESFSAFNESVSALFQVVTFTVFGALIVATGWSGSTPKLIAFIAFALLVARPAAVFLSFVGVRQPLPHKLFIAWFGPKGVASMLFALLVLNSTDVNRSLVFDVASFTVLASILAHGLTDTLGARWLEARLGSVDGDEDDIGEQVERDQDAPARPVMAPARDE